MDAPGVPEPAFTGLQQLRACIDTGLVRAEGIVVSFGRRVAFAEARLTDACGRLYASATSSPLVMER